MKHFSLSALTLLGLLFGFSSCHHQEAPAPTEAVLRTATYNYAFNRGQLGEGTAYQGAHATNMTAVLTIEELSENRCRVKMLLNHAIEGTTYLVHAHDAANQETTPNNTPYLESPNEAVLSLAITGAGHSHGRSGQRVAHITAKGEQESPFSFDYLTQLYDGFLVVHDPLQPLSTTNLQSYLVVNKFAR